MGHKNAPLTPEGRKRLIERVAAGRPISHVAAEAGISRACLSKWYGRWQQFGDLGLVDHSSRPGRSPSATDDTVVKMIVTLRQAEKWGPARIAATLNRGGIEVSAATVHRVLTREGLGRLRDMDRPTGESARAVVRAPRRMRRAHCLPRLHSASHGWSQRRLVTGHWSSICTKSCSISPLPWCAARFQPQMTHAPGGRGVLTGGAIG